MADVRRQLYDHYHERRDRLASMQDEAERTKLDLDRRAKKLLLEEQDAADARLAAIANGKRNSDRRARRSSHAAPWKSTRNADTTRRLQDERAAELIATQQREKAWADKARDLDARCKQYDADVLRLNRLQGIWKKREADLGTQSEALTRQARANPVRPQRTTATARPISTNARQTGRRGRAPYNPTARARRHRTAVRGARRIARRTANDLGDVARPNRAHARGDARLANKNSTNSEPVKRNARPSSPTKSLRKLDEQLAAIKLDQAPVRARSPGDWLERGAPSWTRRCAQLKQAQDNIALEEERLRREAQELRGDAARNAANPDGILQGRHAQLADTHERLDLERQTVREAAASRSSSA